MYIKSYTDDVTGVVFPDFSATTNIFTNIDVLYNHIFELMYAIFEGQTFLIEILKDAEEFPDRCGGLESLFESMKVALTVNIARIL
jgi:hypothetical protein